MMKSILVPFHNDDIDQAALDTALLVAEQYKSYLEGLFVWQPPQIIAGAGEGITLYGDYITQIAAEGREMAKQARERFCGIVKARNLVMESDNPDHQGVRVGWYEGEGLEDRVVGDYGRVFDLIVISRTGKPTLGDWQATCEGALFESGRPILLTPAKAPSQFGQKILIAWNGSTETARTIALGMPFLQQADSVILLTVEEEMIPGPNGKQISRCLQRNDLPVQTIHTEQKDRPVGQAILDICSEHGCDLIFKGAYTQSRFRQMIFGGATRRILSHATVPVLMAH